MRHFRYELRRAFGWPWIFAVVLMWIPMVLSNTESFPWMFAERIDSTSAFINAFNKSAILQVSLFAVACPFARSYLQDIHSGAIKYAIARTGRAQYAAGKFAANAIASAAALFFSQFVFLVFCILCFPYPDIAYRQVFEHDEAMFALRNSAPVLYYAILLGIQIVSSVAWSSLALALSCFVPNQYIVLCFPFLLFTLVSSLSAHPAVRKVFDACWLVYNGNLLASQWGGQLAFYLIFFAALAALSFLLFFRSVMAYDGSTR